MNKHEHALSFAPEISHGVDQHKTGHEFGQLIIDPTEFSQNHGENWRERTKATEDFSKIFTAFDGPFV